MGLPRVNVTTRQVLSNAVSSTSASGFQAAIVGQFQKGSFDPVLVSTIAEFLQEFTPDAVVPEQSVNKSPYYSIINFLNGSGSPIWVKRVETAGQTYSGGVFLTEDAGTIRIDLTTGGAIDDDGNFVFETLPVGLEVLDGKRVCIYGNIPDTNLGQICYLSVNEITKTLGIFSDAPDEEGSFDEDDRVAITTAFKNIYLLVTEYVPEGGYTDIESVSIIDGFSLFSNSAGDWGNDVRITVEVPRVRETGISCSQSVRVEQSELPVNGENEWSQSEGEDDIVPVMFFPVDDGDLPSPIESGTIYRIWGYIPTVAYESKVTGHVNLVSVMNEDDENLVSLADKGSGSMIMTSIGTVASVRNITDSALSLTVPDNLELVLSELPAPCFAYATTPAHMQDLENGVLYYLIKNEGSLYLSESTSIADVVTFTDATGLTLHLCFLLQEEDATTIDVNGIVVKQTFPKGAKVTVVLNDEYDEYGDLAINTSYYVEQVSGSISLYEDALLTVPVVLPDVGSDYNITIIPDASTWENLYEEIDLEGDIDYISDTIQLNESHVELGNAAQLWVPGERVKVNPTGTGSVLPRGITQYSTYVVLPLNNSGLVKLGRMVGVTVLENMDDVSILTLDPDFKGNGTLTLSSANSPLATDTFRVSVYKSYLSSVGSYTYDLLEEFICSLYRTLKDSAGKSYFLDDRLESSKYIGGTSSDVEDIPMGSLKIKAAPVLFALGGGDNGADADSFDFSTSLDKLSDSLQYPYDYLLDGGLSGSAFASYQADLIALAERRGCFAILSTPPEIDLGESPYLELISYAETVAGSSFRGLFGPWQKLSGTVSGTSVVPPDGLVAARMAQVDRNVGIGNAAAGILNGSILSAGSNLVFSETELNDIYDARINPLINVQGYSGTYIWGNMTGLNAASPLGDIHVRKLDNKITSDLKTALRRYLHVNITTDLYAAITQLCTSYLAQYLTTRVIDEATCICNNDNNSDADRDQGIINIELAYKPVRSSKNINLIVAVTPAGIDITSIF